MQTLKMQMTTLDVIKIRLLTCVYKLTLHGNVLNVLASYTCHEIVHL